MAASIGITLVTMAVMVAFLEYAEGLSCMACGHARVTSSGLLSSLIPNQPESSDCETPTVIDMFTASYQECEAGSSCLAYKGETTFDIPAVGMVTYVTTVRGCMPSHDSGCVSAVDDAANFLSNFLEGTDNLSEMKGSWCYCNSHGCHAGDCGSGNLLVAEYCVPWWVFLIAALLVLGIIGCICGCCCCCFCRRN